MEKPRKRYRLDLDTHAGVQRCMQRAIKELKALVVADPFLDPIRINRHKALVSSLKTLSEQIAVGGLAQVPDDILISEVVRRRDARLGHTSLTAPSQ